MSDSGRSVDSFTSFPDSSLTSGEPELNRESSTPGAETIDGLNETANPTEAAPVLPSHGSNGTRDDGDDYDSDATIIPDD